MTCDHKWTPILATMPSGETLQPCYSCSKCGLAVDRCPLGMHPFGFPYYGPCQWCKPERPARTN